MIFTAILRRQVASSTPPVKALRFASPLPSRSPFASSSSSSSKWPLTRSSSPTDTDLEEGEDDDYVNIASPSANVASVPTLLQPRVIIYDGVCHLCHRGVKWVIKVDKHSKIKFCCLQSKAAEPYLRVCGVDREDVLKRFLFIEGPEAYYEGSTAALKVASYLPFPYSALSTLEVVPTPLRDAVYDYVAKRRYDWFGKEDRCIIMKRDHELLDRFIDRDEMLGGGEDNSQFF